MVGQTWHVRLSEWAFSHGVAKQLPRTAGAPFSHVERVIALVVYDANTHIAGSTFDLAHRTFNIDGVQVFHLGLGDLAHL